MTTFEGSMAALVTPFKDGKVDEDSLRKLADFQIENGTHVLVPCGTTGESATLTHEEHDRVISIVVEHVNRRVKVLAGAGSNCTDEAVRLHRHAKKAGADGALHITPYYNKPTQEGLFQHFQAIAKSNDLPVVLYNVPGRTGVNMSVNTTVRLAALDTIVGIKEASGSLLHASQIISQTNGEFSLLSGEDALNYPLYCLGAKGCISVTANVMPQKCFALYDAVQKNDFGQARRIHDELLEINQTLFVETNPIPVKAALALMGFVEEEYRLPLVPLAPQNREKLKEVMKKYGLIF